MTLKLTDNATQLSTTKTNSTAGKESVRSSIEVVAANGTNYTLLCEGEGYELDSAPVLRP